LKGGLLVAGVVSIGVFSSFDSAIAEDESTEIDLTTDVGLDKEDFSWDEFD
jgi:hypothetical protein